MNVPTLASQRISLRPFHETDMEIVKALLTDPLATSNLPWVSATSHLNAENFYTHLMDNDPYFSTDKSHLMDFALLEEYWHRDILIEAFQLLHPYLIEQGISELYLKVESTHTDSCDFAKRIGFLYEYSYEVKDGSTVRLYHMILIPENARFNTDMWQTHSERFIEAL